MSTRKKQRDINIAESAYNALTNEKQHKRSPKHDPTETYKRNVHFNLDNAKQTKIIRQYDPPSYASYMEHGVLETPWMDNYETCDVDNSDAHLQETDALNGFPMNDSRTNDTAKHLSRQEQLHNQASFQYKPNNRETTFVEESSIEGSYGEMESEVFYGNRQNTSFPAADVEIVVFGVAKEVSNYQVSSYAEKRGIKLINCELLTKWDKARSNTFKLTMKAQHAEIAFSNSVWPCGVGVRRFKQRKSIPNNRLYKLKNAGTLKQKKILTSHHPDNLYQTDLPLKNRFQLPYE